MFLRLAFVTFILALTALGAQVRRDANTVESDIQNITVQAQALDSAINAFPASGGNLSEALAIHEAAVGLINYVNDATKDVNASDLFTEGQGSDIMDEVNTLVPIVQEGCSDLEAKANALTAIGAGGIAKDDIEDMQAAANGFGSAILTKMPTDQQTNLQQMLNEMSTAFSSAISAF